MGLVYLIYDLSTDNYKIGITGGYKPEKRLKQLQTGNSETLFIRSTFESKYYKKIEKTFHNIYSHKRISGEWFSLESKEVFDFLINCQRFHDSFKIIEELKNKI